MEWEKLLKENDFIFDNIGKAAKKIGARGDNHSRSIGRIVPDSPNKDNVILDNFIASNKNFSLLLIQLLPPL